MNSVERRRIRQWLIDNGFERTQYTNDDGHGEYAEFWNRDADEVVLRWGPRGED